MKPMRRLKLASFWPNNNNIMDVFFVLAHFWKTWRWTNFTFSFSCLLLLGPFHWTMVFPMSSRNTSPRLKLFQLISTLQDNSKWSTWSPHKSLISSKFIDDSHCAHLFGSHPFLSFNVEKPLNIIAVDFSVPHARRDPPLLKTKDGKQVFFYGLCEMIQQTVKFLFSTHIIPCLK